MTGSHDSYCCHCGSAFPPRLAYPRTCASCGMQTWANPIPVSVVLVPVVSGARTGLLVIRRAIPPQIGKLALVGGFLDDHERWQEGGSREVREETGVSIDPSTIEPMWFASTEPRPNRVLLFGVAAPIQATALPPFVPNTEVSERGIVFGPEGLDETFAFPLHAQAARMYFSERDVLGPHGFVAC